MELSVLNVINPIMHQCATFTLDVALFTNGGKKCTVSVLVNTISPQVSDHYLSVTLFFSLSFKVRPVTIFFTESALPFLMLFEVFFFKYH